MKSLIDFIKESIQINENAFTNGRFYRDFTEKYKDIYATGQIKKKDLYNILYEMLAFSYDTVSIRNNHVTFSENIVKIRETNALCVVKEDVNIDNGIWLLIEEFGLTKLTIEGEDVDLSLFNKNEKNNKVINSIIKEIIEKKNLKEEYPQSKWDWYSFNVEEWVYEFDLDKIIEIIKTKYNDNVEEYISHHSEIIGRLYIASADEKIFKKYE